MHFPISQSNLPPLSDCLVCRAPFTQKLNTTALQAVGQNVSVFSKDLKQGGSYKLKVVKFSFLFILVLQSVLSECLNRGSKFLHVSVGEGKLGCSPRPGLLHSQRRYRKQEILFVLSETVSFFHFNKRGSCTIRSDGPSPRPSSGQRLTFYETKLADRNETMSSLYAVSFRENFSVITSHCSQ